jgi:hypothetical protein
MFFPTFEFDDGQRERVLEDAVPLIPNLRDLFETLESFGRTRRFWLAGAPSDDSGQ